MYIKEIELNKFRSFNKQDIVFSPKINIFYGRNGQGKTNVLEAIYFLSTLYSHRNVDKYSLLNNVFQDIDTQNKFAIIRADVFLNDEVHRKISVQILEKGSSRAKTDNKRIVPAKEIIGEVRAAVFSPSDVQTIQLGPDRRRKLIDSTILQKEKEYDGILETYKKIQTQKIAFLKNVFKQVIVNGGSIPSEYFVWTDALYANGKIISDLREKYVSLLNEDLPDVYKKISGTKDNLALEYIRNINGMNTKNKEDLALDEIRRGQVLFGPHKDDIGIKLNGIPAKEYASAGEQWSIMLSIKLREHEILSSDNSAILLLDDVFSELDEKRRANIKEALPKNTQIFITSPSKNDIPKGLLQEENAAVFLFDNGDVKSVKL
jgi:DNA replication and repair protein RecF